MRSLLERKAPLFHNRLLLRLHCRRYLRPACGRGIVVPLPLRPRGMPAEKKRVRSAVGYDNQRRRSHARAAPRLERQLAPAWPTYEYLARGPMYLELRLTLPVERRHAETAFERFPGWVLRTLRPHYPGASFQPHTLKPGGQHLHPCWWRLNMDHSGHGHAAGESTSRLGPQRFRFCAATKVIEQLLNRLRPPILYDLVCGPRHALSRRLRIMSSFVSPLLTDIKHRMAGDLTRRIYIPGGRDSQHLSYSGRRRPPFQRCGAFPHRG